MRVVTLRRRVSFWDHYVRRSVECCYLFHLRDVVRILCIFSFLSFLDTFFLYMRSCHHLQTYIVLIFSFILLMYVFFFHIPFHVLFLFYLYTHASYYLYTIYYFRFTQRCFDKFCLKCFKNTGCQSLLAINSLLAKFFKSLCQDRFYCIQQVNMS